MADSTKHSDSVEPVATKSLPLVEARCGKTLSIPWRTKGCNIGGISSFDKANIDYNEALKHLMLQLWKRHDLGYHTKVSDLQLKAKKPSNGYREAQE